MNSQDSQGHTKANTEMCRSVFVWVRTIAYEGDKAFSECRSYSSSLQTGGLSGPLLSTTP